MSQLSVYNSDTFNDLWNLDFGGYATEVLDEAGEILLKEMRKNCQTEINHKGDSELVKSIKKAKPKKAKNGAYLINVGPSGYSKTKVYYGKNSKGKRNEKRKYPVSNALKAIWKEYGIPTRKIDAQPFISPSVHKTEKVIQELLQKRFEEKAKL